MRKMLSEGEVLRRRRARKHRVGSTLDKLWKQFAVRRVVYSAAGRCTVAINQSINQSIDQSIEKPHTTCEHAAVPVYRKMQSSFSIQPTIQMLEVLLATLFYDLCLQFVFQGALATVRYRCQCFCTSLMHPIMSACTGIRDWESNAVAYLEI